MVDFGGDEDAIDKRKKEAMDKLRVFEIHYGGEFVESPKYGYEGGEIKYVGDIDHTKILYGSILRIVEDLGFEPLGFRVLWKVPGFESKAAFEEVKEDTNLEPMFSLYMFDDVIPLYVAPVEEPLAMLLPSGKVLSVKDGANLEGIEQFVQKKKEKKPVMFVSPSQVQDLLAAGYNLNDEGQDTKFTLVEELSCSEEASEFVPDGINEEVGTEVQKDEEIEVGPNGGDCGADEKDGKDENEGNDGKDGDDEEEGGNDGLDGEFVDEFVDGEGGVNDAAHEYPEWAMPRWDENFDEEDYANIEEEVKGHMDKESNMDEEANMDGQGHMDEEGNMEGHGKTEDEGQFDYVPRQEWDLPVDDSDSEGGAGVRERVKVWDSFTNLREVEIGKKSRFKNAHIFRGVFKTYALQKEFDYTFTKNEATRIGIICKVPGCAFRCWCSRMSDSTDMEIKTWEGTHTCEKPITNSRLTADWIAARYLTDIKDCPTMSNETLCRKVQSDYGDHIPNYTAYRAIFKAKKMLEGDLIEQYHSLHSYALAIAQSNPESRCKIMTENGMDPTTKTMIPRFLRLYMRFKCQRDGFLAGCRPFIGIDGCHLKGFYGGQVLAACAWDANDGLFPIAIAVVEQETKSSWRWFLEELFDDYGYNQERASVFISDKQKGLVELFNDWLPDVEHRYCMRHLYDNWFLSFKSAELRDQLWKCATANSVVKFEKQMGLLALMNKDAHDWLRQRPAKGWCKAFFTDRAKNLCQTNSMSECFNAWIKDGRQLPIIQFCEYYRQKLMARFYCQRQRFQDNVGLICPNIKKMVNYNREAGRKCFVRICGDGLFEVDHQGDRLVVDLPARTCSCLDFQLSGIPCPHAIAAILRVKENPDNYVHAYYHIDTFKKTYSGKVWPVPGKSDWPSVDMPPIQPPIVRKPPGRPKMRRKVSASEGVHQNKVKKTRSEVTCTNCQKKGHNSRTCGPKDVGETAKEREQRQAAEKKIGKGKAKVGGTDASSKAKPKVSAKQKQRGEGSSKGKHTRQSRKRRLQDEELGEHEKGQETGQQEKNLDALRESVKNRQERKKLHMRAKRAEKKGHKAGPAANTGDATMDFNETTSNPLPKQCTPEEVEAKRLEALAKQKGPWMFGVNRPKRHKLATMRKIEKNVGPSKAQAQEGQTMDDGDSSVASNPLQSPVGIAQAELLRMRDHEWDFHQLNTQKNHNGKKKGQGRVDAGASRFTQEARFTRSKARNESEANKAASQPQNRSPPPSSSGPQSQP